MLVLVALLMSAILLALGLAVDAGQLFAARRTQQEAADAAAWAGAVALHLGGNVSDASSAAATDATRNGFTSGGTTTVTVSVPPTSGSHNGDPKFVEVKISRSVRLYLVPGGSMTVSTRGVAGSSPVATGYALMATAPTKSKALKITGSGNVVINGGSVIVNSTDNDDAADRSGSGQLSVASPGGAYVAGGANGFSYPWVEGVAPVPDPLAGYPKPSSTDLTNYGNVKISSGTTTLQPGIYDKLEIKGGAQVTFAPGIYILRGGMDIGPSDDGSETGAGNVGGTGVTFFNTGKKYPTRSTDCKKIKITHDAGFNVSAPATGTYEGMLIYQDPDCKGFDVEIKSNGSVTSPSGTIYVPGADVKISGSGNMTMSGQVIAETLTVSGSGQLTINYDAAITARATLPALVE